MAQLMASWNNPLGLLVPCGRGGSMLNLEPGIVTKADSFWVAQYKNGAGAWRRRKPGSKQVQPNIWLIGA